MFSTNLSVAVSITLTVEVPSLATYTQRLSGVITIPCGPGGTAMVAVTRFKSTSMTLIVLSLKFPT